MKRDRFFPVRQGDQVLWLENYADKLPKYATPLGLLPADVTAIVADCGWLKYLLQPWLPEVRAWTLACTNAVSEAQSGVGTSPMVLPVFTPPALPDGVTPRPPGALLRIFTQIQVIKKSGKCTDAIAADLKIVGAEMGAQDLSTARPVISATVSGVQVFIKWGWGGLSAWLDACELMVDRGDGKGYVPLAVDTTPGYTDTAPFPATRTIWSYKAIYRVDAAQVGQWSQPVSVAVGG